MPPHRTSSEDQQQQQRVQQHLLPDASGVLAALEARGGVTPAVLVCTEGVLSSVQATLALGKLLTCAKVSIGLSKTQCSSRQVARRSPVKPPPRQSHPHPVHIFALVYPQNRASKSPSGQLVSRLATQHISSSLPGPGCAWRSVGVWCQRAVLLCAWLSSQTQSPA